MASYITQSISTAAASVSPPTPVSTGARDQNSRAPASQEQIQRMSQEASRNINSNLKTPDRQRSVQIPKRVESPFASQEENKVKKEQEQPAQDPPTRPARAVA